MPIISPTPLSLARKISTALQALGMIGVSIAFVDLPLASWFHAHVSPRVYEFSERVSAIGGSAAYFIAALLVYVLVLIAMRRGWAWAQTGGEALARACLLLLGTGAISGMIIALLKAVVARARPGEYFQNGFYGFASAFSGKPFDSFPSSHTVTAFAVAISLGMAWPRARIVLFALACALGAARLVETDHYLADVLASAFITIAVARWLAPKILCSTRTWPSRMPWRWFAASRA